MSWKQFVDEAWTVLQYVKTMEKSIIDGKYFSLFWLDVFAYAYEAD